MLRSRPVNKSLPINWPPGDSRVPTRHVQQEELGAALSTHSAIVSSNMNILLCLAAAVEGDLEALLVAPFDEKKQRDQFSALSISILREELIRLSSLERYLSYFATIYGIKTRDILSSSQFSSLRLLFNLRNLIIHASTLRGKVIRKADSLYLYIDDPFYMDILKSAAILLNLGESFYCLPEELLGCNVLVDALLDNSRTGVLSLYEQVTQNWPDVKPDCSLPWISAKTAV
jgi:hypothetical protein